MPGDGAREAKHLHGVGSGPRSLARFHGLEPGRGDPPANGCVFVVAPAAGRRPFTKCFCSKRRTTDDLQKRFTRSYVSGLHVSGECQWPELFSVNSRRPVSECWWILLSANVRFGSGGSDSFNSATGCGRCCGKCQNSNESRRSG